MNWDVLCRPKERGGVGCMKAKVMNKALLSKLAWRMLTQENDIWCKVIRMKYRIKQKGDVIFKQRQKASVIW